MRLETRQRTDLVSRSMLGIAGVPITLSFVLDQNARQWTLAQMIAPPRHQCCVYEGAPSSHLADIAQTLKHRLATNHRCLYLNTRAMVAGMRSYLSSEGVDLAETVARGSLILSSDQKHLIGGKFDTNRMLGLLKDAMNAALAAGYTGLWAAGDMTWEFGSEGNLTKLMEYERSLEDFMRKHPALSGVCLYHRDTLPSHAIETAFQTHRALYRSATLSAILQYSEFVNLVPPFNGNILIKLHPWKLPNIRTRPYAQS